MLKQYPTARFILMRAGWYIITFLVAVTINFYLPRLGPSDPVDIIMGRAGQGLTPEQVQIRADALRKEFGLVRLTKDGEIVRDTTITTRTLHDTTVRVMRGTDIALTDRQTALDTAVNLVVRDGREEYDTVVTVVTARTVADTSAVPVKATNFEQFSAYVKMCLTGNLGTSFFQQKKVLDIIKESVPWTLALQLPTILFGWIIGNLLGALAAYRRGIFDKALFPFALVLSAFPFFVFGMLLVYFFGVILQWFPVAGGVGKDFIDPSFTFNYMASIAHHYVLPFFSIFLILAGGQAIGMRSMGIYELGTDYIKYAKWLGLKETKVLQYLFRNAMLPQITGLALSLGTMVGGALITEMIFSYPGLGTAMLRAITQRDYPVIQGVTLIITVSVLIANFTVDILIAFLDPRVKAGLQVGKGA
jgi:peptide/nickel transport system permease protein